MAVETVNLAAAKAYLMAIEDGDIEAMSGCYDPDATQVELPNKLKPGGDRRSMAKIKEDFARGKGVVSAQSYEVKSAVASGDTVALRVLWTGTLAIAIGALKAGDTMVCHSAIFFAFRDGKIVEQYNYDCFEAF